VARYRTTIESTLPPAEAFAYMADFSNASRWDPSVSRAEREGGGELAKGAAFQLVARFAGRDVPLRYEIVEYEPPRLVRFEAPGDGFVSRDTITVEVAGTGSRVHYDALLDFQGVRRLLDPVMALIFRRVGDNAASGMRTALNP
jgi:hypothetical protein